MYITPVAISLVVTLGLARFGAAQTTNVTVTMGPAQQIFDSATEHCGPTDIEGPDINVSAFRNSQGEIVLLSGNAPDNYAMFGTNFDNLQRDLRRCFAPTTVGMSPISPQQWLFSGYTIDGTTRMRLLTNTTIPTLRTANLAIRRRQIFTDNSSPTPSPPTAAIRCRGPAIKTRSIIPVRVPRSRTFYPNRPNPYGHFGALRISRRMASTIHFSLFPHLAAGAGRLPHADSDPRCSTFLMIWDGQGFNIPYHIRIPRKRLIRRGTTASPSARTLCGETPAP